MVRVAGWTSLCVASIAAVAAAQIPLNQEPRHRVVFENALFRILDVRVPPGDTTLDHLHDRDIVTVSMNEGADTRIQSQGQAWTPRPRRPLGDAAVAEYAGKPGSHRVENVGSTPYQLFAVENLRASGWTTAPALAAPATTLSDDARSFRVYDVRLARETSQTSHVHAVATLTVLLTGKVMSEGSDAQAKANAPAPVGLKQLDQPGQWVYVPPGESHHLVRLGTSDARVIEIEVR
jgi:hypothetical protein